MVSPKRAVTTAADDDMGTEISLSAPPIDDDGSDNLSDPNVRVQEDLQSLLDEKQKSYYDLQKKSEKTMVDLKIERQKTQQLEKDRCAFRSSCKSNAKHTTDALTEALNHHKALAKSQEKSKTESLKSKDSKIKDLNGQLGVNMKSCKKMMVTVDDLRRTVSRHANTISCLRGDIMSKLRECDMYRKENKSLSTQVASLTRKCTEVDERKMEHALQLEKIKMETENIKLRKYQQTNVLKEQTNVLEHERKLKTIAFTARTRQSGKAKETKRKLDAKLKKFQGGTDDMGVLHGELRKQNTVNGGCVPNPGTTSLTEVSFLVEIYVHTTVY